MRLDGQRDAVAGPLRGDPHRRSERPAEDVLELGGGGGLVGVRGGPGRTATGPDDVARLSGRARPLLGPPDGPLHAGGTAGQAAALVVVAGEQDRPAVALG